MDFNLDPDLLDEINQAGYDIKIEHRPGCWLGVYIIEKGSENPLSSHVHWCTTRTICDNEVFNKKLRIMWNDLLAGKLEGG